MDSQRGSRITEFATDRRERTSVGVVRGYGDLGLVVVLTLAMVAIALAFGERGGPSWLRVPLGFLFVFVLPGYALTAALFPRANVRSGRAASSVTPVERVVLSVGLSLVVVPLVSIALTLLSYTISADSVLLGLGAVTVGSVLIAGSRRYVTPPRDRFALPAGLLSRSGGQGIAWSSATVAFTIVVLLAGVGITAAIVGSGGGDTYSELAILSSGEDGDRTVTAYPDTLSLSEPATMSVEVANHERRPVQYTVVVVLEEVRSGDGVINRSELDRFDVELAHGERTVVEHDLEPTRTGESLRVSYLLYVDDVPDQPAISNADRSVHFFADVVEDS